MTLEEKNLLLKDLCARLPYNVKCYYQLTEKDCTIVGIWGVESVRIEDSIGREKWETVEVIKPYLRPLSSMTSEEEKHFLSLKSGLGYDTNIKKVIYNTNQIDWLNEHNFDYRELIDKGLAIELK